MAPEVSVNSSRSSPLASGGGSAPPEAAPSAPRERNDTIELLRIVAAFGIIWFHFDSAEYKRPAYAGLVFFLVVAVIFQQGAAERENWSAFIRKRAGRLLIPWAAWFVIYGLMNPVIKKPLFPYSRGPLADLLCGPWIGLWYLPFALLSGIVAYFVVRAVRPLKLDGQFTLYSILAIVSVVGASLLRSSNVGHSLVAPWAQWLQAAPSLPLGLALAAAIKFLPQSTWRVLALLFAIVATCTFVYAIDPGVALPYALGTGLVAVGFLFPRRLSPQVSVVSSLCLGAYLVHSGVMGVLKLVLADTHQYALWFVATVVLSFAAVFVMKRLPGLKRIV